MTEPPDDPQALAAHMRAKADELEAVAKEAVEKVERLRAAADALEGLTSPKRSVKLNADMTGAQLRSRGEAIAESYAKRSSDPLLEAIAASKWKSLRRYAQHLGVVPATISNWRDGITETPPEHQIARIERELGVRLPLK